MIDIVGYGKISEDRACRHRSFCLTCPDGISLSLYPSCPAAARGNDYIYSGPLAALVAFASMQGILWPLAHCITQDWMSFDSTVPALPSQSAFASIDAFLARIASKQLGSFVLVVSCVPSGAKTNHKGATQVTYSRPHSRTLCFLPFIKVLWKTDRRAKFVVLAPLCM